VYPSSALLHVASSFIPATSSHPDFADAGNDAPPQHEASATQFGVVGVPESG